MALNPNRRRPRVPSGTTPEKVAKPKAGPLYQLSARVTCEALDFGDPASASTELGIVITGAYRDDGGADGAQARYFDRQRGVVPFHDVPPSGPWDGQAVLGRYENFREADAPGNESNKMEESMQLQFDKTGEGQCDVVGSGTNSFGKFFMCGTGERGSDGVWELDVSRGYAGAGWSSDSLRAYAAPPVAAPASDFVASLVEAAAPAPARNYGARRDRVPPRSRPVAIDIFGEQPPAVVRPATSTAHFQIGEQVESTVETPWEKDRGVIVTVIHGGRREVVTTTNSVVVLKTTQLVQTTLNVDEVRRCEATRERLRSSTKDYVQARIDGTIFGDADRKIRNRFKSAENDEDLRQFEAGETDVRCTLCRDARTWSLETDIKTLLRDIKYHYSNAAQGRKHRELLVAKASDSSWRTPIAPVAAPQPLAPVEAPIELERAVLQLQAGGIPGGFFPDLHQRSQGVVLYGSWHKIDGAEVEAWAWYGLDERANPPSLLEALPEGSMQFWGKFWHGDDRTPVDRIITGEHRGAPRQPDLIEKCMTLRLSVTPVDEVYKVDGDGENGKGHYTILGSAKRSDLCANQNFTASSDGSTPSTRRLPRRRLRRLPEGAGPDSLVHFLTGSGSIGVWVLELERTYTPKVEEELPETRPRSPRPSTPMTVSDEYPNKGRWSVPEENYVNGISHLFFGGKLPDVDDGERLSKKYKKSSEEPSPAELAALDELKLKFLLDKSLAAEEERSSEPAASSSTGTAMADVIPFLTEQNRPRATLKSDGPFELKTMLERSCLAGDPTRPCLRIKAPLKDEATGETVAQVSLTFEGDAMDLTAAPPDGIFSGHVSTGKGSSRRRYGDRMMLQFEAVEEANTFKVHGYGANARIGKYRMEGTAVPQGDGLYLDMKRIKDPNAPDLPEPPNTKVCPVCEKLWKKGTRFCDPHREGCGEPLTESARIQKAYEAYAAAPDDEELLRTYLELREPNRSIFKDVPYPAPPELRTLLVDGEPDEFLAACASAAYVRPSRIPDSCIKPGYHLRVCKVYNAGGGGHFTHGAKSIKDALELCKIQVAGNVISSVDIN